MKRLAAALILACLTLPIASAGPGSTSMPSFWRYTHPDAKALIGVEWSRLMNSSMGQEVRRKLAEQDTSKWTGIDLVDQISRVFISTPGNPEAAAGDEVPGLIAVQGNFDMDRIRELAAEEVVERSDYESVEILKYTDKKGKPMAVALVSPQLLLLGDQESIEAGIDHYVAADPTQTADPLYVRASELSSQNDIWVVANASPADFSKDGAQQAQFLKDVDSIEAGLSLQSGLGLQLNLGTKSGQSASELAAGLQLMAGMMLASQQQKPGLPNLAEKLTIVTDDTRVKMALTLDEQEVQQSFGQLPASMQPAAGGDGEEVQLQGKVGGSGDWTWGGQPQAAKPKKPQKQVITIWGLQEGVREIPVDQ